MNKVAVVVAGGVGTRMQSSYPKQFVEIGKKPVLYYTLYFLKQAFNDIDLIVVLPKQHIQEWKELCIKFDINISHNIVEGGTTRFHSVENGLRAINKDENNTIVAIHDGVRPFVNQDVIAKGFSTAQKYGSAIPVIPLYESVREVSNVYSKPIEREKLKIVQTPQFFQLRLIRNAYNIPYSETFTDDASVYETLGKQVVLIDGNKENIKITVPSDILYANALINERYKQI